jgi:hypothetical protein
VARWQWRAAAQHRHGATGAYLAADGASVANSISLA